MLVAAIVNVKSIGAENHDSKGRFASQFVICRSFHFNAVRLSCKIKKQKT